MKFLAYIFAWLITIFGIFIAVVLAASGVNLAINWLEYKMAFFEFVQAFIVLLITLPISKKFYKYSKNDQGINPIQHQVKTLATYNITKVLSQVLLYVGWSGLALLTIIGATTVGKRVYEYAFTPYGWLGFLEHMKEYSVVFITCGIVFAILIWWSKQLQKWSGN